jgi:uncharacterized membrane protein YeaQ/YmgE (transglycosylase-associated protein family)
MLVLAQDVMIRIGSYSYSFNFDFLIFLLIAAFVGIIAEYIVGWRVPLGIFGAIVAGVVGIWLMTRVITIAGIGDIYLNSVPLVRALIGALIFVALWHALTYGLTRRRRYRTAA